MLNFKEFVYFHNTFVNKKKQYNYVLAIYYPFVVIGSVLGLIILKVIVRDMKINALKNQHRNSDKFKKVIKEGVFFTTVEYHEK